MRKLFLYVFFATAFIWGCKKDDSHIFASSPDQRLNDTIAAYQAKLVGAQYGWKGLIYPKGGGTYSFYFKFTNANRVQMLSGFDSTSAVTLKESSYRLKALQQPSLIFDTYSYLHVLSDPNPYLNGGIIGAGLQSDFEFYFDAASADTIRLIGRVNGSTALLIRATQAESTAYTSGQLAKGFLLNKILTYFKRLTVGSVSLDFYNEPNTQTIKVVDNTGNLLDSTRMVNYYLTLGGIQLATPVTFGNQSISRIDNFNYLPANQTITCTINNIAATLSPVTVPLKVDLASPRRWWSDAAFAQTYWFSVYGFHKDGIDDAFGILNLKSGTLPYYYLIYFPKYGGNIDLFAPAFLDTAANSLKLDYGTAPKAPAFTSDGRAVFSLSRDLGNYPTTGPAALSKALLYTTSGFYLVQTSASTYDMVNAENGLSWISWISSQ